MTWFVMIPPSYKSLSDTEKRRVDFRVEYTDPNAIKAVEAGKVINGSNYGNGGNPQMSQDLIMWKGPYPTEDAAKKAQDPIQQSPNPISDAVTASKDALGGFNIANWFLRIGEILLGLVLIGVGVARITGVQNAVTNALKNMKGVPIPV